MEKIKYRAVIEFLYLKKKTNDEIKAELDDVYGDSAPSIATVKRWTAEFKRGRTDIFDEARPGRPKEVRNEEMINKIHDIVLEDRRVKIFEIVEKVKISYGSVVNILHEDLGMTKLSARWVPRLLTVDNKRNRVVASQQCLELFQRNPNEFMRRYVTVDETWIHYYTPETKEQSKQWTSPGERAPKKAKTVPSAGKVMATVFWDSHGIIHIDYLEKGKTITGAYYSALLDRFDSDLKEKRPHLVKKKILFHHDNALAHSSGIVAAKLHELRYELLPHPPYSPDLAPCDYFLFPNLKKSLAGKKFRSNGEVIAATEAYFADLPKSYFLDGIKKLEYRWTKCIELKGDYVEK
jgi:histone-lysine N-methyltransferase SETMAR